MGEEQVINAEKLFKAIYDDSPIGIEIYDSVGKLIDLNQSCMELFGVSNREDVKGFDLLNDPNIPREYLSKLKQRQTVHFESSFDFSEVKKHQLYQTTKSGIIYLDILITPLFLGDNENISNYLVQIQEISDIKLAEQKLIDLNMELDKRVQEKTEQLRKSEENWQILVEEAPDIIFTVDRNRKILYINQVPKGMTLDQALGTDALDYVAPAFHKVVKNSIERVFETGDANFYEISAPGANNTISWYSTRLRAIKENEEVVSVMLITRDITERKEAELKLKESEERYHNLVDNILDIIYEIELDGKIIYLSPQTIDTLGYKPDELINQNAFRFIHPDDQPKVLEDQKYVINSGDIGSVEFRIRHKEGRYVTVSSRGQIIEKEGDNKIIGLFRDVTERKKIEEKVQKEKEKAEMYLNLVNVIIVALDKEGKISLINKKGNEILEWSEGDLIGKNWFEYCLPPRDKDRVFDYFKKLMKGELDVVPFYENPVITKDGDEKLIAWSTIMLKDSNGNATGALSSGEDITEKKEAEQLLKESEEKFRTIAEQSLMGILILQDNKIKYINSAALAMLDYNKDEVLNMAPKGFINFIHPDDRKTVIDIAEKRQKGIETKTTGYEHRVFKKNGEIIWIQNYSKSIYYKGNFADLITVIDITERKKAEEKIKESEKILMDLLEAVPVGISITTPQGKTLKCNSHAYRIFGYDEKEEFLNTSVINVYHNAADREKFLKLHEKGLVKDFEVKFKRKNGTVFWASLTSVVQKIGNQTTFINSFQDITDRKTNQLKLQQSEAELSAIYNYIPIAILLVDKERRIRKINKFALNFTDRREEEVFGLYGGEALRCIYSIQDSRGCGFSKHCHDCVIRNTVLNTYNTKTPYINVEATLDLLPDSNIDKAHLLLSTVPLETGGEELVLISLIDITERKKTEQDLKKSETKYRTVINNIPGMVYRGYPDWTVEFLSNSEVISGYTEEDFISQRLNWVDIIHPDDRDIIVNEGNSISAEPVSLSQIYRILTKEGFIRWVNDRKISFFDESGVFCGVDGIVYDITDYKIAEQNLKESEEKFRNIAEETTLGLLILQDGYIQFANSAIAEITGYSLQEINNWSIMDLSSHIHKKDMQFINIKVDFVQSEDFNSSESFEFRLITKSGRIKWIETIAKSIMYLGKKAVFATLIDTTAKKKIEDELKEISKLKSELISRTSHELKTPLVSIKGYTDLLLTQHYDLLDYYTVSVLHEIKQGCYRLESLIKDLLETSELETGEVILHKFEDDLAFLIKFCIKDLRGMIEMRNHRLILDIHDNLITSFEKERIFEVIMNLLSNAIKYTPPNGKITIKSEIKEESIIISVEDNGIGLTDEEKNKLFKKFGKIERYGKGLNVISEGSGLGLYISKKIIELHGGDIWVESNGRDKGSSFYFSLPIIKR